MRIITIQILFVTTAWTTNFENLSIGGYSFNYYEILRWLGGIIACCMMLLIVIIYIEKDVQDYLNITENYITIRSRMTLTFMGIMLLLVSSLFGILFGCLDVDSKPILLFKLIFFTIIFLIPLIFILLKTTLAFSSNVNEAVKFLKFAADQDFTKSITIESLDEFGELRNSIGFLKNNFSSVIKTTKVSSDAFTRSSENIDGSIRNLRENIDLFFSTLNQKAKIQLDSTTKAGGKLDEMANSISDIFDNIKNQADMVNENSLAIEEMTNNIYSITQKTKTASESSSYLFDIAIEGKTLIEKTSGGILEIEQASRQIYELNQIIDNITEQTEMLAMNAAIEASHAGDVGKGFAIVASEMRNLAESTRNSAESIYNLINDILSKIKNTLQYSQQSNESFLKINNSVDKTKMINAEIAGAMEKQSLVLKEVLTNTTNLVSMTEMVGDLSNQIKKNSDEIKTTFNELNRSAGDEADAIDKNSRLVWETVGKVNEIVVKNKQIANELLTLILQFKV